MVKTEDIIARIKAKQECREIAKAHNTSMEEGISANRYDQMLGRAFRDNPKNDCSLIDLTEREPTAANLIDEIRSRVRRREEEEVEVMKVGDSATRILDEIRQRHQEEEQADINANNIIEQIRARQHKENWSHQDKFNVNSISMVADPEPNCEIKQDPFDYAMQMLEKK